MIISGTREVPFGELEIANRANRLRLVGISPAARATAKRRAEPARPSRAPSLNYLSPDALDNLQAWAYGLWNAVENARAHADAGAREAEKAKRRAAKMREVPQLLAMYMHNGASPPEAVSIVSEVTGLEAEAIELKLVQAKERVRLLATESRNHEMLRLYRLGHTHKEIGEIFDLHEKSCVRIIRQVLKANRKPALPPAILAPK